MSTTEQETPWWAAAFDRCGVCGQLLPLRPPTPGEQPKAWWCRTCNTRYDAVLDAHGVPELVQHVRPGRFVFADKRYLHVPDGMASFIHRSFCRQGHEMPERRQARRYRLVKPVVAMPLDEDLEPAGDPFMVMSQDISTTGIGLLSTRAVPLGLVAIELSADSGEGIQLVARVVRCRPVERFYNVGAEFLSKVVR